MVKIKNFDPDNKKTYFFVDNCGMLLEQSEWDSHGKGFGDSIEKSTIASIAYDTDFFLDPVYSCYDVYYENNKKILKSWRHPSYREKNIDTQSRDHIKYTAVLYSYLNRKDKIKELYKGLKWKISEKYKMSPTTWLLIRALGGNLLCEFLYYIIYIPMFFLLALWSSLMFILAGIGNKKDITYDEYLKGKKANKFQKKVLSLALPVYAVQYTAFVLFAMRNSIGKYLLKKICLMMAPKNNLLLNLLLGRKVDFSDIIKYEPKTSWIWSARLFDTNRNIKTIKNSDWIKKNTLDRDILIRLYEKIN